MPVKRRSRRTYRAFSVIKGARGDTWIDIGQVDLHKDRKGFDTFVELKLYERLETTALIREQSRQRFGKVSSSDRGALITARPQNAADSASVQSSAPC